MYPQQSEMLFRARLAEVSGVPQPRAKGRGSLRITLDARRARRQSRVR
jgi:hypothetical protein